MCHFGYNIHLSMSIVNYADYNRSGFRDIILSNKLNNLKFIPSLSNPFVDISRILPPSYTLYEL